MKELKIEQERKILQSDSSSKIISVADVDACAVLLKSPLAFSHVCNLHLWGFGSFAAEQHGDGCLLFTHCGIYNWLLNTCTLKLATRLSCLCFTSKKVVSVFRCYPFYCLISLHALQPIWQFSVPLPTTNSDSI